MELRTQRLLIQKLKEADAQSLYDNYCGDIKSSKYLARKPHSMVDETRMFILNWAEKDLLEDGHQAWSITFKEEGVPIGLLILVKQKHVIEIHFGISPSHSGFGLATELCQGVITFLKGIDGVHRLWTYPHVENKASIRVLEKCGFRKEGVLRNWLSMPNLEEHYGDCFSFSMVW